MADLFLTSYEAAQQRFRADFQRVQTLWPQARLESHPLQDHPDLSIEWIWADAHHHPKYRLILSAGLHGIEGHVGSALMHLFVQEYLPRLDPTEVGVVLVHVLNPWGMKHNRRVNAHNVDLNRNFFSSEEQFSALRSHNPAYDQLVEFLNPARPITSFTKASLRWEARLLKVLASLGVQSLQAATVLGQYRHPRGIFYGGAAFQEETQVAMRLFRSAMRDYEQMICLDFHTGYGPRGQLDLLNASPETRSPEYFQRLFNYPHVQNTSSDTFYTASGLLLDWLYDEVQQSAPQTKIYATALEFGTLGQHTIGLMRSLRALVLENQAFWHGASESARRKIEAEFMALFYPQDATWKQQVVRQTRKALDGILRGFGLLTPSH